MEEKDERVSIPFIMEYTNRVKQGMYRMQAEE